MSNSMRRGLAAVSVFLVCGALQAGPRGGGASRGSARTNVTRGEGGGGGNVGSNRSSNVNQSRNTNINQNRNTNINTNVNRNTNVNVNRDVDIDVHGGYYGGGYGCCYHPVATAAAVTAATMVTAAVVGSIVNTLPTGCVVTVVNGISYQQCGSTWYQPQYVGSSVSYVVVAHP
jgi:hypothetical protein